MFRQLRRGQAWKPWSVGILVAFAIVMVGTLTTLFQDLYAQSSGGDCLRDAADFDQPNICRANDVRIGALRLVEGPDYCTPGEEIEITVAARLLSGADVRYDIGLYIAEGEGDAMERDTTCFRDYLHPVSSTNEDLDPIGGTGPFFNGELDREDTCGDIQQDSGANYFVNEGSAITITCQDSDGNGVADVGTVVVWDNNAMTDCSDENDTVPDQTSKCRAGTIDIAGLQVPLTATIEIEKELVPDGDLGQFNLQIDGQDEAVDAGDGDTTGPVTVTAGTNVDPGDTHEVGESAGTDTDLADYDISIVCVHRDTLEEVARGQGPGPLDVPVLRDDDIVCTITNERKQGLILFEKEVVGGSAQPSEWTFTVDDQTVAHEGGLELYIGTYSVTEDGDAENNATYKLTGASGVCSLEGEDIVLAVTEEGGTCTVTNTRMTASLDLVKVVDDDSMWTVSYTGPDSRSGDLGNGDHLGPDTIGTGTYMASEVPAAGQDGSYYASTGSCSGATENGDLAADGRSITDIVIEEGDEVVCTFTNSLRTGSITVAKETNPSGVTDTFDFVSNITPPSFSLSDGASRTFDELPPGGTYIFAEAVPPGWDLVDINCAGQEDSTVEYGDYGIIIDLAPDEELVCTFTDEAIPAIDVVKTADPTSVTEPGDVVEYSVEVTNVSAASIPLVLTSLVDDLYGDLADAENEAIANSTCELEQAIQQGDSYACTFEAEVTGSAGDEVTDTVTATAATASGREAQASDDAVVAIVAAPILRIRVTKTADPEVVYEPGGTVTYTVEVTNESDPDLPVTLTGLEDDIYGDLTDENNEAISNSTCELGGTIQPDDSYSCTFMAEVEGQVGDEVTDTVTATGVDPNGREATAADDATVTVVTEPPDTGVDLPTPIGAATLGMIGFALLLAAALVRRWPGRAG